MTNNTDSGSEPDSVVTKSGVVGVLVNYNPKVIRKWDTGEDYRNLGEKSVLPGTSMNTTFKLVKE